MLCIPPGTIVARYSKILFTFAVSGALHVASDFGGGVPLTESGALRFFCTQTIGIMLEDSVQEIYRRVFRKKENKLAKAIGYIWVVAFLSWSTPVWVYPVVRTMEREDMLLKLSVLYPLVSAYF